MKRLHRRHVPVWISTLLLAVFLGTAALSSCDSEQPAPVEPEPEAETEKLPEPAANPYDLALFRMDAGGKAYYDAIPDAKRGIDVSAHQGVIDWAAVAADGIDYAMVRVGYRGYTEGDTSLDELFYENVAGARENGLDVGVYFFSQAITRAEAVEEAEIVLRAIEGLDITYPVIFDWEEILQVEEARTNGMDPKTLTSCARVFCRTIEKAGYRAGVYFNQDYGYGKYELTALEDYVLWLAQYQVPPDFRYNFHMWQYAADGKVDGIETDVDMNLSFWQETNTQN